MSDEKNYQVVANGIYIGDYSNEEYKKLRDLLEAMRFHPKSDGLFLDRVVNIISIHEVPG